MQCRGVRGFWRTSDVEGAQAVTECCARRRAGAVQARAKDRAAQHVLAGLLGCDVRRFGRLDAAPAGAFHSRFGQPAHQTFAERSRKHLGAATERAASDQQRRVGAHVQPHARRPADRLGFGGDASQTQGAGVADAQVAQRGAGVGQRVGLLHHGAAQRLGALNALPRALRDLGRRQPAE